MDIIMDADIANVFGKISKINLLNSLFPNSRLFICAAVKSELEKAKSSGHKFVENVFNNVTIMEPVEKEIKLSERMLSKRNMGKGETESIATTKSRKMLFLTNDRIATNEASKAGVETMNLPMLLRQIWKQ